MGSFSYADGISVAELLVYFPSIFLSGFLVWRHGFKTNCGYMFLAVFSLVRIIGNAANLARLSKDSQGLRTTYLICSSIGLTPLFLACSGLLSRANLSIRTNTGDSFHKSTFTLYRIFNVIAIVLSVYGLTTHMDAEGLAHPPATVKVSMIMYIISWVALNFMLLILVGRRSGLEPGEGRTLLAVAISSPFLLVRTAYSVLTFFVNNNTFGLLNPNETVQLVMDVIEEFAVIIVLLSIGLTLRVRYFNYTKAEEEAGIGAVFHGHSNRF
ncbi:hypothetical protein N7478_012400 [Penicillium angulare]|uniref:uncharacterized protein n=1 Tax=Penicillium angulare TaxID=116970 RepID=UPI00253F9DC8|nr:uncharacterized protein N7478_012400 [Penicillium angulare]KAJ5259419.1 hypothetical protein N7478_012400 [Penicillium angulare]